MGEEVLGLSRTGWGTWEMVRLCLFIVEGNLREQRQDRDIDATSVQVTGAVAA